MAGQAGFDPGGRRGAVQGDPPPVGAFAQGVLIAPADHREVPIAEQELTEPAVAENDPVIPVEQGEAGLGRLDRLAHDGFAALHGQALGHEIQILLLDLADQRDRITEQ